MNVDESRPVRRLLPDPGETTVASQLEELDPSSQARDDRPWVGINFVTSLDGRATIDGRSGALGTDTDTEMLQRLRTRVDAVMIGAGTLRVERYGRIVSDPGLRAYREADGLAGDPLAVIVSGRLDLPWDTGLFTDGDGEVVIFTTSSEDPPRTETPVEVIVHDDRIDVAAALGHLRNERGIRSVLCEGGPSLHGQLQAIHAVDELFLTTAPKVAAGTGPPILLGGPAQPVDMELAWLLEADGELFGRYRASR